jgi:magnesium chelatase family protein
VRQADLACGALLASVSTFALEGVRSHAVTVEVDVRRGLPAFTLVGLPDRAVRESRERVRAAVQNSGLEFPLMRITVNLAPAHVRKAGPGFDLAIAVGVLVASRQVEPESLESTALCGELSLSGELRSIRGALAAALGARDRRYDRLIVPPENAGEAALVSGIEVIGALSLRQIAAVLAGDDHVPPASAEIAEPEVPGGPDLRDVRGQDDAKRALEIAAAGGHNLLMVGPPGVGKTMLARRLPGLLPPPDVEEALEITQMHSAAGLAGGRLIRERPFRAPHHTISAQGLVGGGAVPRPGEITLAHRGVLFLDELAEFGREALDALRQPLEEGRVDIMRGQRTLEFPANAVLVAACNSCPCGRPPDACRCRAGERDRYLRRLNGPLLDRLDLVCDVRPVPPLELVANEARGPATAAVRERVAAARERQRSRLARTAARCNADMDGRLTRRIVVLDPETAGGLIGARERGTLSGRGHDRVLRVARTIADLAATERIEADHVAEALGLRRRSAEA